MLELLLTTAVIAAAAVSLRAVRSPAGPVTPAGTLDTDLPCPWCQAATAETDAACPSCHRPFALS